MREVVVTGGRYEKLKHELNQDEIVKISGRLGLTLVQVFNG
jgi:hypothetical protein